MLAFFIDFMRKLLKMSADRIKDVLFTPKTMKIFKIIVAFCLVAIILFWGVNIVERKVFYPLKFKEEIVRYSNKYSLDTALVFSVVKCESSFNEKAVSDKGALGLMQITKPTANYIAQKLKVNDYDLFNVETNLEFGCYYLSYLYNRFSDTDTVIIAYNAGEGNVSNWLRNKNYSFNGVTLDKIPFPETRLYLKEINKTLSKYKNLYGNIVDKR